MFAKISQILKTAMTFKTKDEARGFFLKLTQKTKDWNRVAFQSQEFNDLESEIFKSIAEVSSNV